MSHIIWQNNTPTSAIYGDIYFSQENGLAETEYVFLQGNNLPQRWQNICHDFHIIETGFGTGLNFFAALKLWLNMGCKGHLYYSSIEKYPLTINEIKQAISLWPEFTQYLDEFAAQYPEKFAGATDISSSLKFANGKIQLLILWGDIKQALPLIKKPADAWFLDGFSPAKNPDMWTYDLYKNMKILATKNSSFATFTAAGEIRRNLQKHGFTVKKIAGFGQKRHILVGSIGS